MEDNVVRNRQHENTNGDVLNKDSPYSESQSKLMHQINLQRIRSQAQKLKDDATEKLSKDLDELFQNFISEVEQIGGAQPDGNPSFSPSSSSRSSYRNTKDYVKRREKGELPDKVFVTRRSVLTDLLEINHIKTIYHIFVAILVVFSLNTFAYDIVEKGTLGLKFEMIWWGLGKLPKTMYLWVLMMFGTTVIVYPGFYYWSHKRKSTFLSTWVVDLIALGCYIAYQIAFFILPIQYVQENQLPPGSSVVITTEQLRLMMKSHAFVRENVPRVLKYKKDDDEPDSNLCPDFSKYLYFLFAPTLVYRDSYPRTQEIRWSYVVSNFVQVIACVFYIFYIFERFCVPVFRHFNQEHITPKALLLSAFSCMMPGTLVLFISFFAILHSWFNAFAEMLRFGDRMFYKDWWNSTTFSTYYRTWNVVVHDWLYMYLYKDFYKVFGHRNREMSMALVFLISAVFHEYVLVMCFKFFYPVLFVMFMGAGFALMFVKDKGESRTYNVFLWVALFMGTGILMCLYSMEWYARINCPETTDNFLDYVIPRSWMCNSTLSS